MVAPLLLALAPVAMKALGAAASVAAAKGIGNLMGGDSGGGSLGSPSFGGLDLGNKNAQMRSMTQGTAQPVTQMLSTNNGGGDTQELIKRSLMNKVMGGRFGSGGFGGFGRFAGGGY